MANVFYRDQGGNLHGFKIAGDAPTTNEQQRINQILAGQSPQAKSSETPTESPGILGSFTGGIGQFINQSQAGLFNIGRGIAENTDGSFLGLTTEDYERNRDEQIRQGQEYNVQSWSEAKGPYETAASIAGAIGGSIVPTGVTMGLLASGIGAPLAAGVGAASFLPAQFEEQIQAQEGVNDGNVKSWGRATVAAGVNSLIESVSDTVTAGLAGVIAKPTKILIQKAAKDGVKKAIEVASKQYGKAAVTKALAGGAATGAIEETLQSIVTRAQAEMPLMDEEAKKDYIESAIVGGIVEGIFGGVAAGGVKIAQNVENNRLSNAIADAEMESKNVGYAAANYPSVYNQERTGIQAPAKPEPKQPEKPVNPVTENAKQLLLPQVKRPDDEVAKFSEPIPAKKGGSNFTEEEYRSAVAKLRDAKYVHKSAVKRALGVGDRKAASIYQEMLDRGDAAIDTSSINRYAKIIAPRGMESRKGQNVTGKFDPNVKSRDYTVAEIDNPDMPKYKIRKNDNGTSVLSDQSFVSAEAAHEAAMQSGIKDYSVVRDPNAKSRYGVYENQYSTDPKTGDMVISGRKVVDVFNDMKSANEKLREYDPAYSPETHTRTKDTAPDELVRKVSAEMGRYSVPVQKYLDNIVGAGRTKVEVVPQITPEYLKKIGVPEASIPKGMAFEGVTVPMKDNRQLVLLAHDLTDPKLSASQRLEKLKQVATHEMVHTLRGVDVLNRKEWDTLFNHALTQKVPGKNYTWVQAAAARNPDASVNVLPEEAIAEMIRRYTENPTSLSKPDRGVIGKIVDFIKSMVGLNRSEAGRDLINRIINGEMSARRSGEGGMGERYAGHPFFSAVKVAPFYMRSYEVIEGAKADKATPNEWMSILKGVGKEELEYLDLESKMNEWLRATGAKSVPKGELLDFIKANSLQLELIDDYRSFERASLATQDSAIRNIVSINNKLDDIEKRLKTNYEDNKDFGESIEDWIARAGPRDPWFDDAMRYMGLLDERNAIRPPRDPVHEYTSQSGGEDYTEALFILPSLKPAFSKSNHYGGEENVLAAVRFKTRIINGKKTLAIEEIQSDLHQTGRRDGYLAKENSKLIKEITKEIDDIYPRYESLKGDFEYYAVQEAHAYEQYENDVDNKEFWKDQHSKYIKLYNSIQDEYINIRNKVRQLLERRDALAEAVVPDAPLKSNWDEFAFKKMVQYAIENGYEQISWNGSPEAVADSERYPNLNVIKEHVIKKDGTTSLENQYYTEHEEGKPTNVTGIINFYTTRLRNVVSKFAKRYDAKPYLLKAEYKSEPLDSIIREPFDLESLLAAMSSGSIPQETREGVDVFKPLITMSQIVRNQRQMDINAAAEKAGLDVPALQQIIGEHEADIDPEQAFYAPQQDTAEGNPDHDRWVMPITDKLVNVASTKGFTFFSAVKTDGFDDWFKGSVIVNKDGTPKVMYHGTSKDKGFKKFNVGNRGAFFTESPEEASQYAIENDSQRYVYEDRTYKKVNDTPRVSAVYLSVKNPYTMTDSDIAEYQVARNYGSAQASIVTKAKRAGHDGINFGGGTWVVFSPDQIRPVYDDGTRKNAMYSAVVEPKYSATAAMGQRVPSVAPKDKLDEIAGRMTYDAVTPVFKKLGVLMSPYYKARYQDAVDGSFIALQDKMLSVGQMVDRVRQNGGFISNETDPYLQAKLFTGEADYVLRKNNRELYEPMANAVKGLGMTDADVRELARISSQHGGAAKRLIESFLKKNNFVVAESVLYALHAQERNAEMESRNLNVADVRPEQYRAGSGMRDEEAIAILEWAKRHPKANDLISLKNPNSIRSIMRRIIASTNAIRVDSGLSYDYDNMVDGEGMPVRNYADYVPLRSFAQEHIEGDDNEMNQFMKSGKGFNIMGKEDMSATGRASTAVNLISHAIMQNEEAIIRASKNRVGQSFLNLIESDPDGMAEYGEVVERKPVKYVYNRSTGSVQRAADNSYRQSMDHLIVKVGGDEVVIKMGDPRIARAFRRTSPIGDTGLGTVMKGMLALNRFLAATRTSYNLEFIPTNMFRDFGTAMANLTEYEINGLQMEAAKLVGPAFKAALRGWRNNDYSGELGQAFDEFQKFGGMTSFLGIRDLDSTIRRFNAALSEDPKGSLKKSWEMVKEVGNLIEDWNVAAENATRLAAYKTLRDKFLQMTDDPSSPANLLRAQRRAALAAKNLTVDFNAGGELKPFMNAMYLFYNASLQGSMALIAPLARSKKMRALWTGVAVAGFVQDQLMSMLSDEDDDGIKEYDKIKDYILEHNIVLMNPLVDNGYINLPIPYLFNAIYNSGRAISKAMRGAESPGKAGASIIGTFIDSINPWSGANSFLNFVAPTSADPFVELSQNENFAGAPIRPPDNPYQEGYGVVASQRYWNNTNPMAISIADWMHKLTGGEGRYMPGIAEYSPNDLEYMFNWLTGGAGMFVKRGIDLVAPNPIGQGVLYDALSGGDFSMNDIPMARRFIGNISSRENMESYIEGRNEVFKVKNLLKDARNEGDIEKYRSIASRYQGEYRIIGQITKIENARRKLSQRVNRIEKSKMSDEKKKEAIRKVKEKQEELIGFGNSLIRSVR